MRIFSLLLFAAFLTMSGARADKVPFDKRLAEILPPADQAEACFEAAANSRLGSHEWPAGIDTDNRPIGSAFLRLHVEKGAGPPDYYNYYFGLEVAYEGRDQPAVGIGYCGEAQPSAQEPASPWIHCGIDCDGGAMEMMKRADGGIELRWRKGEYMRLADCGGGAEEGVSILNKNGDGVLSFTPTAPARCEGLKAAWDSLE